jgi:chitinase
MVSIGGAAQSAKFSSMSASDAERTTFVDSVIQFLVKYNFDGVMIDWQYPKKYDYENYIKLLDKFDAKFAGTPYSIGITGPPTKSQIDEGFDVKNINKFVLTFLILTFI